MLKTLEVRLTRDRHHDPLVVVESMMGNGLEASPAQLRALAAALLHAADDAELQPTKVPHFAPMQRTYNL
jgi:hypothetical protein